MATKLPWPEKAPDGVDPYGFDFTLWLEGAETIASVEWSIEVDGDDALDPDAADMLGDEDTTGAIVQVVISEGVADVDYTVKVLVTTSTGRVKPAWAALPIREIAQR